MAQLKDLIVNGPSRFIGDVYATTFTGNLAGNASTATSATTAAALTGKTLVTAASVTTSNYPTYVSNHIPTMSFMAYWNGAYNGTSSNLTYCKQGTIIGSNNIGSQSVNYATTSGSCSGNAATATKATQDGNGNVIANTYLPLSGGRMTGTIIVGSYTAFGQTGGNFYLGTPNYPLLLRSNGTTTINGNTLIHSGNYNSYALPLSGGTLTGGIEIGNNSITSANKEVLISYSGVDTYLKGRSHIYLDTPNLYQLAGDTTYTILHSGNYNSYALPISGGTLTGSVMMSGMDTNLIRNITAAGTTGWARNLITLQVDGVDKFAVGAYGEYTVGVSNNGINFGYIGCNSYDGLNLRISASSLSWGNNSILHSGNYSNYALHASGNQSYRFVDGSSVIGSFTQDNSRNNTWYVIGKTGDYNVLLHSNNVGEYALKNYGNQASIDFNNVLYNGYQYTSEESSNNGKKYGVLASFCYGDSSWQIVGGRYGGSLLYRSGNGTSTSWGEWKNIAFTDSDISGNAATATNADTLDGYHASSFYQQKSLRSDQNSIYDLRYNYGTYDKGDFGGTYQDEYPTGYGTYLALTYNDKNTGALMFFDAPTSNMLGHIYVRTRGAGDFNTTYSEWGTLAYLTDNVASATKLQNSRTIWGHNFDGTGNISGGIEHVSYIEMSYSTPYIDFHYGNSTTDYTSRIIEGLSGQLTVTGKLRVGLNDATSTDYAFHVVGAAYTSKGLVSDGPVKVNELFEVDGTNGGWYGKLKIDDDLFMLGENTNIDFIKSLNIKKHNTTDNTDTSIVSIDNWGDIILNGGSYEISTRSGSLGIGIHNDNPNVITTPSFLMSDQGYIKINARYSSSPSYPLDVNGTIQCTKLLQTSDIKYKTNIKQIEYEEALKIIENLNPVTWDWNENTIATGSSSGFVAQEAEEFIPNAISRDNENNLSLDYTQLHSYEIKVIQEQQKEIIKLKEKLKILEKLIS